tara:strand:- start:64 stop:207 length:144 start_codon:yes stop_codon:yes gene_type:complete
MSRFIQEPRKKEKSKKEKTRTLTNPGSYTSKQLKEAKKVYMHQGEPQ